MSVLFIMSWSLVERWRETRSTNAYSHLVSEAPLIEGNEICLLVNGKGHKERVLQISTPELVPLAKICYSEFSEKIHSCGTILLNRQRRLIITQSVCQIVQKHLKQICFACHVMPICFCIPLRLRCQRPGWIFGSFNLYWDTAPFPLAVCQPLMERANTFDARQKLVPLWMWNPKIRSKQCRSD